MSNERTSSLCPSAAAALADRFRTGPTWRASQRASRLRGRRAWRFAGQAFRTLPPRRLGLRFAMTVRGAAARTRSAGARAAWPTARLPVASAPLVTAERAAAGVTATDNSKIVQIARASTVRPFHEAPGWIRHAGSGETLPHPRRRWQPSRRPDEAAEGRRPAAIAQRTTAVPETCTLGARWLRGMIATWTTPTACR